MIGGAQQEDDPLKARYGRGRSGCGRRRAGRVVFAALLAGLLAHGAQAAGPGGPKIGSQPQQLLNVALNVADFERSRGFYLGVLGLKENLGSQPNAIPVQSSSLSFTGTYADTFLTISHDRTKPAAPQGGGLAKLAFKVADVRAVVARAKAAGYPVLHEPEAAHGMPGLVVGIVADPDGNSIEVVQSPGD